jgi:hypothetical protein
MPHRKAFENQLSRRAEFLILRLGALGSGARDDAGALSETLHDRRHVAAPEWENIDEMFARHQSLPRGHQVGLERLLAPIAHAQNGVELPARQHKQFRPVPAALGAPQIGLPKRVAITVGVRMADNDHDFRHARFYPLMRPILANPALPRLATAQAQY